MWSSLRLEDQGDGFATPRKEAFRSRKRRTNKKTKSCPDLGFQAAGVQVQVPVLAHERCCGRKCAVAGRCVDV